MVYSYESWALFPAVYEIISFQEEVTHLKEATKEWTEEKVCQSKKFRFIPHESLYYHFIWNTRKVFFSQVLSMTVDPLAIEA